MSSALILFDKSFQKKNGEFRFQLQLFFLHDYYTFLRHIYLQQKTNKNMKTIKIKSTEIFIKFVEPDSNSKLVGE